MIAVQSCASPIDANRFRAYTRSLVFDPPSSDRAGDVSMRVGPYIRSFAPLSRPRQPSTERAPPTRPESAMNTRTAAVLAAVVLLLLFVCGSRADAAGSSAKPSDSSSQAPAQAKPSADLAIGSQSPSKRTDAGQLDAPVAEGDVTDDSGRTVRIRDVRLHRYSECGFGLVYVGVPTHTDMPLDHLLVDTGGYVLRVPFSSSARSLSRG